MKFKAGTYWIGDPCYAVKDENWRGLLEVTNYLGDGEFTYNGKDCFSSGTAYGDGLYKDNYRNEYGVDAGLLGIMPIEICDGDYLDGGHIFTFEKDFEVEVNNGVFKFGDITIDTEGSGEEEE